LQTLETTNNDRVEKMNMEKDSLLKEVTVFFIVAVVVIWKMVKGVIR